MNDSNQETTTASSKFEIGEFCHHKHEPHLVYLSFISKSYRCYKCGRCFKGPPVKDHLKDCYYIDSYICELRLR